MKGLLHTFLLLVFCIKFNKFYFTFESEGTLEDFVKEVKDNINNIENSKKFTNNILLQHKQIQSITTNDKKQIMQNFFINVQQDFQNFIYHNKCLIEILKQVFVENFMNESEINHFFSQEKIYEKNPLKTYYNKSKFAIELNQEETFETHEKIFVFLLQIILDQFRKIEFSNEYVSEETYNFNQYLKNFIDHFKNIINNIILVCKNSLFNSFIKDYLQQLAQDEIKDFSEIYKHFENFKIHNEDLIITSYCLNKISVFLESITEEYYINFFENEFVLEVFLIKNNIKQLSDLNKLYKKLNEIPNLKKILQDKFDPLLNDIKIVINDYNQINFYIIKKFFFLIFFGKKIFFKDATLKIEEYKKNIAIKNIDFIEIMKKFSNYQDLLNNIVEILFTNIVSVLFFIKFDSKDFINILYSEYKTDVFNIYELFKKHNLQQTLIENFQKTQNNPVDNNINQLKKELLKIEINIFSILINIFKNEINLKVLINPLQLLKTLIVEFNLNRKANPSILEEKKTTVENYNLNDLIEKMGLYIINKLLIKNEIYQLKKNNIMIFSIKCDFEKNIIYIFFNDVIILKYNYNEDLFYNIFVIKIDNSNKDLLKTKLSLDLEFNDDFIKTNEKNLKIIKNFLFDIIEQYLNKDNEWILFIKSMNKDTIKNKVNELYEQLKKKNKELKLNETVNPVGNFQKNNTNFSEEIKESSINKVIESKNNINIDIDHIYEKTTILHTLEPKKTYENEKKEKENLVDLKQVNRLKKIIYDILDKFNLLNEIINEDTKREVFTDENILIMILAEDFTKLNLLLKNELSFSISDDKLQLNFNNNPIYYDKLKELDQHKIIEQIFQKKDTNKKNKEKEIDKEKEIFNGLKDIILTIFNENVEYIRKNIYDDNEKITQNFINTVIEYIIYKLKIQFVKNAQKNNSNLKQKLEILEIKVIKKKEEEDNKKQEEKNKKQKEKNKKQEEKNKKKEEEKTQNIQKNQDSNIKQINIINSASTNNFNENHIKLNKKMTRKKKQQKEEYEKNKELKKQEQENSLKEDEKQNPIIETNEQENLLKEDEKQNPIIETKELTPETNPFESIVTSDINPLESIVTPNITPLESTNSLIKQNEINYLLQDPSIIQINHIEVYKYINLHSISVEKQRILEEKNLEKITKDISEEYNNNILQNFIHNQYEELEKINDLKFNLIKDKNKEIEIILIKFLNNSNDNIKDIISRLTQYNEKDIISRLTQYNENDLTSKLTEYNLDIISIKEDIDRNITRLSNDTKKNEIKQEINNNINDFQDIIKTIIEYKNYQIFIINYIINFINKKIESYTSIDQDAFILVEINLQENIKNVIDINENINGSLNILDNFININGNIDGSLNILDNFININGNIDGSLNILNQIIKLMEQKESYQKTTKLNNFIEYIKKITLIIEKLNEFKNLIQEKLKNMEIEQKKIEDLKLKFSNQLKEILKKNDKDSNNIHYFYDLIEMYIARIKISLHNIHNDYFNIYKIICTKIHNIIVDLQNLFKKLKIFYYEYSISL